MTPQEYSAEGNSVKAEQISTVLFDTEYKRKLKIKDWLHTKMAFYIFVGTAYWVYTREIDGGTITIIGGVAMFFYMRDTTLLHEKDKIVWGVLKKNSILKRLEQRYHKMMEDKANSKIGEEILALATIEELPKKKTFKKRQGA